MPGADTPHKMWGGRFRQPPDLDLLEFTSSFPTDRRLLRWDVVASIAHVQMLGATGIIPASDAAAIADGLRGILARSEEHTSELQSRPHLVCRLLLEKKKKITCTSLRTCAQHNVL